MNLKSCEKNICFIAITKKMEGNKTISCPFLMKAQLLSLQLCTASLKCQITRIAFSGTRPQQNKPLSFLLQLWIVAKLKYSYKFAPQKVIMACYCSSKGNYAFFFNYLIIVIGWKKGKRLLSTHYRITY